MNDDLRSRIANIRLLAMDSDGVLTDGGVYIMEDGTEFRRFNIKDGLGLKRVMEAGIHVAIISGASNTSVVHRAHKLGIKDVYVGVEDKLELLMEICQRLDIFLEEVAYIGDDLPDLDVMQKVGISCAPSNAISQISELADYVTDPAGGHGAVREICNLLMKDLAQ